MNKAFVNGFIKRAEEAGIKKEDAIKLAAMLPNSPMPAKNFFETSPIAQGAPVQSGQGVNQNQSPAYSPMLRHVNEMVNLNKPAAPMQANVGNASMGRDISEPILKNKVQGHNPFDVSGFDRSMTNKLNR